MTTAVTLGVEGILTVVACGLVIGLLLGLLAAGGSILAVPALVYGVSLPMQAALLVVGASALTGPHIGCATGSYAGRSPWSSARPDCPLHSAAQPWAGYCSSCG